WGARRGDARRGRRGRRRPARPPRPPPRSWPRSASGSPSRKPCAPSSSRASAGSMTPGGSATGVIVRLDTVDSTQSVAFALAERGADDRTVVVADQQLEGRGRRGRSWRAPAGTSLLASIIVRPRLPQALLSTLSLTTAVAAAEALRRVAKVEARLKWPNDVLVAGKKVAGILLESRMSGGAGGKSSVVTIIGVGINLGQREFPPDLAAGATSIALETGQAPSRESVL